MNIVQITPGAGGMYCGGCFRDNALVAAWHRLGHKPLMLPLYLPMTLDEEDQARGAPIFFGGINVYLEQKSSIFSKLPAWLHRVLDSPRLLKWAAHSAAKTRPEEIGELTLSMLRGEQGRQKRELDELVVWLREHVRPDVICLSNALLLGLARTLRRDLHVPVICLLSGEDTFLDALPEQFRAPCWQVVRDRAREVDTFVAGSQYYAELMITRLGLHPGRVKVVHTGINLDGFSPADAPPKPPVLGFFARMTRDKGLHTLVDAFIQLRQRNCVPGLKLYVGGGLSDADNKEFVQPLRDRLSQCGLLNEVDFRPNLTRAEKIEFYRSLSVLSVPALYGESFGLYLVEAWAAGVPVVQPRHAAFPELIEVSQAGVLCEPGDASALAKSIEALLLDPDRLRRLGGAGRKAALERFSIERTAREMAALFETLTPGTAAQAAAPVVSLH
jgi:glycosyltransferase involved in cell wall biosynthesis